MKASPLRFPVHHERGYVKIRGATVEDEPEGDWVSLVLGGGVNVEGLPFVLRAGVGEVTVDFGLHRGRLITRLQLLDADVPPTDLIRAFTLRDAMDLEADEAALVHIVGKVAGG